MKEHLPVACNLGAIRSVDRPRYNELVRSLRRSILSRREIEEGYSFNLDGTVITLQELAEWISLERLCCPFLTFGLSVAAGATTWLLSLTGPVGVKPLLQAEFPS